MQRATVGLIVLLALGIHRAPLISNAQQPTKVHRIGRLSTGAPMPEFHPPLEAFRQGLRDLGYVEGTHLVIESRYAEGSIERLHDLAVELAWLPVDVLVAAGAHATRAAQHATRTIPL